MARVFISHSSSDAVLADELREWLVVGGHEVFLDHHLHDGIEIGEQWQTRLHERLCWADAVVCLLTSAYVSSTWCTAEVSIAQARGSRLLVSVLELVT
jgi:TIR domain